MTFCLGMRTHEGLVGISDTLITSGRELTTGKKLEWPADEEYDLIMTTGSSATIHLNGEEIEVKESAKNQLLRMKLNKFSLTQLNN